jgi:hypothetical protein
MSRLLTCANGRYGQGPQSIVNGRFRRYRSRTTRRRRTATTSSGRGPGIKGERPFAMGVFVSARCRRTTPPGLRAVLNPNALRSPTISGIIGVNKPGDVTRKTVRVTRRGLAAQRPPPQPPLPAHRRVGRGKPVPQHPGDSYTRSTPEPQRDNRHNNRGRGRFMLASDRRSASSKRPAHLAKRPR